MKVRSIRRLTALVVAFVLVLGTVPAFAVTTPPAPRGPVPNAAVIKGVSLLGMTEAQARATIASSTVVPTMPPMYLKSAGKTFTVNARNAVGVDVESMLNQAYKSVDTTAAYEIKPAYLVKASVVTGWSNYVAKKIYREKKNARRYVSNKRLRIKGEVIGRRVGPITTSSRITARLRSQLTSPSATPMTVAAYTKYYYPSVTRKNIRKHILVVLSERKVYLYKKGPTAIEKRYRCAIGMRAYPTPRGKFKITGKVKNPTWRNPGSDWASGMPAVIGPGPSNPLGTRALYVSAPGIRIHGTNKTWSIGRMASHGCIRLTRTSVEDLYPRVPVGTPVWIIR